MQLVPQLAKNETHPCLQFSSNPEELDLLVHVCLIRVGAELYWTVGQCFMLPSRAIGNVLLPNYNNNSLHLCSAFLGTQSTLHRGNLLIHHQCAASTWMMRRQPYCARTPTTPACWWRGDRVMKPISVWG